MKTLIYVDHVDGVIADATFELVALAQNVSSNEVEALVCASSDEVVEKITAQLTGIENVIVANSPEFDNYLPNRHLECLNTAIEQEKPDLVLLSYSTSGVDIAGGAAYASNLPLVAYITDLSVDGSEMATSSQVYGGKLVANVKTSLPAIAVVMPGAFRSEPAREANTTTIKTITVPDNSNHVKVLEILQPESGGIDLTKAERIVCIGRALGGTEKLSVVEELASSLNAEVAGSRPVIDAGWLPQARQVGKSGTKVKPKLYFMAGVSGAAEHLEGMGDSELIIALNSDEQAPIFSKAHYGAVCDMFHVLPALVSRLQENSG